MDSSHLLPSLKHFVKSSELKVINSDSSNSTTLIPRAVLDSGVKIREFYERAVGKEALEKQTTDVRSKKVNKEVHLKPKTKISKTPFNFNFFMKAIQFGKVKDVQALLEENKEYLNYKDDYGWTPLMSACCAGNLLMVQRLLDWNPDVHERDKRGLNCRDLASIKGHQYIVDTVDQYLINLNKPTVLNREQITSEKLSEHFCFYCKVCKQNIENTTLKKHQSSTVHNFHSSSKRRMQTLYGIPESNKGFQILVKSGWDKEGGLGPSGEGHKYPPKTILKQDRTGLGAKKYTARVTHTIEETKPVPTNSGINKRDIKSLKRREQRLERDLRRLLS